MIEAAWGERVPRSWQSSLLDRRHRVAEILRRNVMDPQTSKQVLAEVDDHFAIDLVYNLFRMHCKIQRHRDSACCLTRTEHERKRQATKYDTTLSSIEFRAFLPCNELVSTRINEIAALGRRKKSQNFPVAHNECTPPSPPGGVRV